MDQQHHFPVIIPAAGIGSRMQSNTAKQYLKINNVTILEHTIEVFLKHALIDHVFIVLHPQDELFQTLGLASDSRITTLVGGAQRVDSVLAGLEYLKQNSISAADNDFVLVHDAARPCLSNADLERLINTCVSAEASGGILANPVVDTVKMATANTQALTIEQTIDRTHLWQAQTPQMFSLHQLLDAIHCAKKAGITITDEASAMEFCNHAVALIEGSTSNIKVTRPSDLALAQFYLSQSY